MNASKRHFGISCGVGSLDSKKSSRSAFTHFLFQVLVSYGHAG